MTGCENGCSGTDLLDDVVAVSGGCLHACALVGTGPGYDALCWGRNNFGQLGDNNTGDSNIPVAVCADSLDAARRYPTPAPTTAIAPAPRP